MEDKINKDIRILFRLKKIDWKKKMKQSNSNYRYYEPFWTWRTKLLQTTNSR